MPNIGETIINKLNEYVKTGKIEKIEKEKNKPEYIFNDIFGIGPKKAEELVNKHNITSIEDLIKNKDSLLNEVQKKGLKYYKDVAKRIPRNEIDEYKKVLEEIFKQKKYENTIFEIVGSYRRNKQESGDIDIIVTNKTGDNNSFEILIEELIERNILIEHFSKGKTKLLGMGQIKNYSPRRIDILYARPEEYAFSILYFTGSANFNTMMRQRALNLGYTMNEHGIYKLKSKIKQDKIDLAFLDEKSIFDFLDLVYKEPHERIDGKDVIIKGSTDENALGLLIKTPEKLVDVDGVSDEGSANIKKIAKKHKKINTSLKKINNMQPKDLLLEFQNDGISVLESLNEKDLSKMILLSNELYYNKDSILTDCQYDILKEYTQHKYPNNKVIKEVGAKVEKNKVTLPYFMGSMDKIKPDTNALNKWKEKFKGPYVVSAKLDGISALFISNDSEKLLYTRGNGKIGQDISHLIPYLNISHINNIVARGELIIQKKVFEEKYSDTAANPRNFVAGLVNKKTIVSQKIADLNLIFYEVIDPILEPSRQFELLNQYNNGNNTVIYQNKKNITNEELSNILLEWRDTYIYEIDGIIVTDNKIYKRKDGNPEHSFAFKMVLSDQVAEVKVLDVLWTPSKDGYLKPRIRIEPITLSGVTIEYATAFNAGFVETNKLGIGSVVEMVRSGDVIPHIIKVIVPAKEPKMPDIDYRWNETHVDIILEETDTNETVLQKQITYFFTTLDIEGLSSGNVQRIINAGFDTIPKILAMSKEDFLLVDGFKEKMATKIHNSIHSIIDKVSLPKLMAATNLFGRGLAEKKITLVLDEYPSFLVEKLSKQERINKVLTIKGFANKSADAFVDHIDEFINFLELSNLQYKLQINKRKKISSSHQLYGKNILFTGIRDKELEEKIKSVGGKIVSSISKNTDYLVVKNTDTDSSKAIKAKELNIPILNIVDFNKQFF